MSLKNILKNLNAYYHRTDSRSKAEKILKNGFNTSEVWVNKEYDGAWSYGDYVLLVGAKEFKNPFIISDDYASPYSDYNITRSQVEKNIELYDSWGGEENPESFENLRSMGYDVILEQGDDICFLYPNDVQPIEITEDPL